MPCGAATVARNHRKFILCAPDHPALAPASPWSAPTVTVMQGHRMTTLWAAMLSAWLAAGQAAPPSTAADRPESPGPAGERAAAPAPERPAGA
jgi:hypothetical protein